MGSEAPVEMFFFPFVGGGHQIPMIDMARLFATHGANTTIITTAKSAVSFQNSILRDQRSGVPIAIHTLNLPEEEPDSDMSAGPFTDTSMLLEPLKALLTRKRPDCVVVDMFHRWSAEVIDNIGVPRIVFSGSGCFARCVGDMIIKYSPHEKVSSDYEPFIIPGLPDKIQLTRSQIPIFLRNSSQFHDMNMKSEDDSFGVVINSCHELELAYAKYLKKELVKKAWIVGPVCLCNKNVADKAERGKQAAIDEQSCLNWLNSKSPNSILYISFGSLFRFDSNQLLEIAHGLEKSGNSFIWVIGKIINFNENWLPTGFEQRMRESNRGLIVRGWAPQMLILEHPAVGGFLTHCGWNSTLEGVNAGVPMITWPLSAEQFYNEKLITDVLGIGVRAGSMEWTLFNVERSTVVGREKVEAAVKALMDNGDEVVEMRRKVKELSVMAKRAVEDGGSSYREADALIEELKGRRKMGR